MKIINKEMEKVFIFDLAVGDTFVSDHELFMRCRYEGDYIYCPICQEDFPIDEHDVDYLAVNLSSGEIFGFEGTEAVYPVECEARML